MPSAKSARVSVRKRSRNLPLRTRAKTEIRKARALIESNDIDCRGEKRFQSAFVGVGTRRRRRARCTQIMPRVASRGL